MNPVIAGIPVSLAIAAVLYINEFPDYAADKQVGKNTLVVRLGRERVVVLYAVMMVGVYVSIWVGWATGSLMLSAVWLAAITVITLPLALRAVQFARKHHSSSFDMVPANALTVTAHLAIGLLLTLVFAWEAVGSRGLVYVIGLGVVFVGFVVYMYLYIERRKNIFVGLKQVVS